MSYVLFIVSTSLSFVLFGALTWTGLSARAGKVWAGGKSVRSTRRREGSGRRRSGRGEREALLAPAAAEEEPEESV